MKSLKIQHLANDLVPSQGEGLHIQIQPLVAHLKLFMSSVKLQFEMTKATRMCLLTYTEVHAF